MTAGLVTQAFCAEALRTKSKVYIARALAAKARGSLGEYQLWASLALELIGKSALSSIHPCLIADPLSPTSLFAAAGKNIGTDLKTITSKTLFERLGHLSERFDKKTQEHCSNMSLKRNSELHSGELPFEGVVLASWEGRYWHTAEVILEITGETLESWLGADQAKAPKDLVAEYVHIVSEAVKVRIETAKDDFASRRKKEREETLARTATLTTWEVGRSFDLFADSIWETICPACTSKAFLAGVKFDEEI